MDSQDYPVDHFSKMVELTVALKALPAQVLQHEYSFENFGSWFLVLRHAGKVFRFGFNGRDGLYSVEVSSNRGSPYHWSGAIWEREGQLQGVPVAELIDQVLRS
jgi:hypothetical protein